MAMLLIVLTALPFASHTFIPRAYAQEDPNIGSAVPMDPPSYTSFHMGGSDLEVGDNYVYVLDNGIVYKLEKKTLELDCKAILAQSSWPQEGENIPGVGRVRARNDRSFQGR